MFHGLHASPLKERLLRGMAFFFLVFTVADVAFAPPCSETNEVPAQRLSVQEISAGLADHTDSVGYNNSQSDQSPEKGCCDEDCCFACAHALSEAAVTEVAVLEMKSTSVAMANRSVSEPPLRSTFHPPRFA